MPIQQCPTSRGTPWELRTCRVPALVPTFNERLAEVAAVEQADGWLIACEDSVRFLVPCRELVVALAQVLKRLTPGPVLEVCAGNGELAAALTAEDLQMFATDREPCGDCVEQATADEALRRYQPQVVLGSFVPVDSRVDEAVLSFPSVQHYVVLGARLGGMFGSQALWQSSGWQAEPLEEVARWMLTRHDVWLGLPTKPVLRHGEAWLLSRRAKYVKG